MTDNEIAAAVLTAVSHYDYHTAEELLEEARSPAVVALLIGIVAAGAIRASGVPLGVALPSICHRLIEELPEAAV